LNVQSRLGVIELMYSERLPLIFRWIVRWF